MIFTRMSSRLLFWRTDRHRQLEEYLAECLEEGLLNSKTPWSKP